MNALAPTRPQKRRFQITRLEERIAPSNAFMAELAHLAHTGPLIEINLVFNNVNAPITIANNNIQIGIQLLTNGSYQIFFGTT